MPTRQILEQPTTGSVRPPVAVRSSAVAEDCAGVVRRPAGHLPRRDRRRACWTPYADAGPRCTPSGPWPTVLGAGRTPAADGGGGAADGAGRRRGGGVHRRSGQRRRASRSSSTPRSGLGEALVSGDVTPTTSWRLRPVRGLGDPRTIHDRLRRRRPLDRRPGPPAGRSGSWRSRTSRLAGGRRVVPGRGRAVRRAGPADHDAGPIGAAATSTRGTTAGTATSCGPTPTSGRPSRT